MRTPAALDAFLRMPFDARAQAAMRMPLRADDVVIATFPGSGTTWTQQICHGLRSAGDMGFAEITHVAPWIELGHTMGIDVGAPQPFAPRLFKTHLDHPRVNQGARYIHVVRNPQDVVVSFYDFLSGAVFDPQAISLTTFVDVWLLADRLVEGDDTIPFGPYLCNYWRHLRGWWQARAQAPVLTIAYEHLRADLSAHVASIATFMGIDADAQTLDVATRQASLPFMLANQHKFSERPRNTPLSLAKVKTRPPGTSRTRLGEAVARAIEAAWRRHLAPGLGFSSYEDLIAALLPPASCPHPRHAPAWPQPDQPILEAPNS